jgi:hypothetical protein
MPHVPMSSELAAPCSKELLSGNVTVRAKNSNVMGNGTGLNFSDGGILATYGNNAVNANATNGAFSGSIPLQ